MRDSLKIISSLEGKLLLVTATSEKWEEMVFTSQTFLLAGMKFCIQLALQDIVTVAAHKRSRFLKKNLKKKRRKIGSICSNKNFSRN